VQASWAAGAASSMMSLFEEANKTCFEQANSKALHAKASQTDISKVSIFFFSLSDNLLMPHSIQTLSRPPWHAPARGITAVLRGWPAGHQ